MRWRKLLAAEVQAAQYSWLRRRSPEGVREHLADLGGWSARGTLSLTEKQLVFDSVVPHYTTLTTIRRVERSGRVVWLRRRRAYDWLLQCRSEADAKTLVGLLVAVVIARPESDRSA